MRIATQLRMERVVRLTLMGVKGPEVAKVVGLSYQGLRALKLRDEYQLLLGQLQKEMLAQMDAALYAARVPPAELDPKLQPKHLIQSRARAVDAITKPALLLEDDKQIQAKLQETADRYMKMARRHATARGPG